MAAQARLALAATGLALSVMSWSGMMSFLMMKVILVPSLGCLHDLACRHFLTPPLVSLSSLCLCGCFFVYKLSVEVRYFDVMLCSRSCLNDSVLC